MLVSGVFAAATACLSIVLGPFPCTDSIIEDVVVDIEMVWEAIEKMGSRLHI